MQDTRKNQHDDSVDEKVPQFINELTTYFDAHKRDLPWRHTTDPYKIMVSEIMLQQTQVNRVIPKYEAFLTKFPNIQMLALAKLAEVLSAWSGLGYNRRAKFLHQAAQKVVADFGGNMPRTVDELTQLPGIGKNTAGAIVAYAYNRPVVFIETNIRTVLLHHFFVDQDDVSDRQLVEILNELIDYIECPREFYWAMMDYGTFLKTTDNNIHRSKHYVRQSKFAGSKRQIRGQVIKLLIEQPMSGIELQKTITDERLLDVLQDLQNEQLIVHKDNQYRLS